MNWISFSSSDWLVLCGVFMILGYGFGVWMQARKGQRDMRTVQDAINEMRTAQDAYHANTMKVMKSMEEDCNKRVRAAREGART